MTNEFKILNEQLEAIIEKTIDPKFRDALKASRDFQTSNLQTDIDYYKTRVKKDPDYKWAKDSLDNLEKLMKGKRSADYVYKQLASRGLAVDKATIEYIGNGKNLNGKILKNLVKAKLPEDKGYDKNSIVFVIADTHSVQKMDTYGSSAERLQSGFFAWQAYYSEGVFYLDDYMGNSKLNSDIKGRTLMNYLNNDKLPDWDFYLTFGPRTSGLRTERAFNKNPYDRVDLKKLDKWSLPYYDKSGYPLDKMKYELIQRLKEYKKSKGAYTAQADELQNSLNDLEAKIKEIIANSDIKDFNARHNIKIIMNKYSTCCDAVKDFLNELERTTTTDKNVNDYYKIAKSTINDINEIINKF